MVIDGGGRKSIAIITLLMIINIFTITLLMTIIILTSRLLQPLALSPRPLLSRAFAVPVWYHSQRGLQHFDNDNHNHNHMTMTKTMKMTIMMTMIISDQAVLWVAKLVRCTGDCSFLLHFFSFPLKFFLNAAAAPYIGSGSN